MKSQRRKLTKKESGFVKFSTRCGNCRFYSNYQCGIVSGVIYPSDCCNLWTSKQEKSDCLDLNFLSGRDIEDLIPEHAFPSICRKRG